MSSFKNLQRHIARTFLALLVLSIGVTSAAPFLQGKAAADIATASNINMMTRETQIKTIVTQQYSPSPTPFGTCKPYFAKVIKNENLLTKEFYSQINQINNWPNPSDQDIRDFQAQLNRLQNTLIGNYATSDSFDSLKNILSGIGMESWVIRFQKTDNPTSPPVDGGGSTNINESVCNDITLLRVGATEWRGFQLTDASGVGSVNAYMTFKMTGSSGSNTAGSFNYYHYNGPPDQKPSKITSNISVHGQPTDGGGDSSPGTFAGQWVDASTITLPDTVYNGILGGDTYRKRGWWKDDVAGKAYAFYFLDSTVANSSRAGLTWSSGKGCRNPMPGGSPWGANCVKADGTTSPNCVPFIAIQRSLALDFANVKHTDDEANALGTTNGTLYNYNPNCTKGGELKSSWTATGNAQVWMYYSTEQDAFQAVWLDGDSNEKQLMGVYTKDAGIYRGGLNGCDGEINPTFPGNPADQNSGFSIHWIIKNSQGNCAAPVTAGALDVLAIGGSIGSTKFNEISGALDTPPVDDKDELRIGCDFLTGNPLNWIVCPFIKAATNLVSGFDSLINSMLNIDVPRIFDDQQPTGRAFHGAWGVFRTFALVIIIIAALIMVISQAAGLEFLDAYTVRKILPRLLLAAIGITFSWQIMELAVTLSNDLGHAVRNIIYTPFSGPEFNELKQLQTGSKFLILLMTTGVAIAYGWVALLTLVLTAVLASIVAFSLLAFREVLIVFLVMLAPFAIACSILPNTQKAWKLWYNTFWGVLIVFLIISAFIAAGRAFSVTSATGGTLAQLIAVIAWFAPYFLIPLAFRMAGGFVSTIGGFVNDRSRGVFDALKKYRAGELKSRGHRMAQGSLWNPDSKATKWLGGSVINRVGSHVGAMRGHGGLYMGFGEVGAAKRANNSFMLSDEMTKLDRDFAAQVDNEGAMAALIFNYDRQALSQLAWYRDKTTGEIKWNDIDKNIAQAKTIRRTGQSVFAAVDALAKSGKVVGTSGDYRQDQVEVGKMLDIAAGGNKQLRGALDGRYRYVSRSVGHGSTGRATAFDALEEMSLAEWSRQKPWDAEALLGQASQMVLTGQTIPDAQPGENTRALTAAERDHLVDLLYSGQSNAYSNIYQQKHIQTAIEQITADVLGSRLWQEAAERYRSKLSTGTAGGPDPNMMQPPIAPQQGGPQQQAQQQPRRVWTRRGPGQNGP